jgi:AcrR family transcriptional regulator
VTHAVQARTRLARAAVAAAARKLFLADGYASATIDLISTESGVPAATIYRLFTSKLGLLRSLIDEAITGDMDPVPLEQRDRLHGLLTSGDPRGLMAGLAAIVRDVNGRDAYSLLVSAAGSDPAAARLLTEYNEQRQRGQALFARALASDGALRPGLTERDAADIIHAIAAPELYRLLVAERGWPPERFEEWLTQTLVQQLLA